MLGRDETVTVLLLFGCRTGLRCQDPNRSHGDLSQIYAKTVHTLHGCMPQLLMASQKQSQSKSAHRYGSKKFVPDFDVHQVDQPHSGTA
jgi:hypothetical protein